MRQTAAKTRIIEDTLNRLHLPIDIEEVHQETGLLVLENLFDGWR